MKSQRLSEEGKQMVRQLQEADTRREMPYARMGRELLEMGIVPTDEMLEAMGMSREEARKYVILKQFKERD